MRRYAGRYAARESSLGADPGTLKPDPAYLAYTCIPHLTPAPENVSDDISEDMTF